MRVLHLFKNYYPPTRGGVEQWINDIAHATPGVTASVLTSSVDGALHDEDDDGVRVVRAPALVRASTAPVVPSWTRWIRELEPDLVHMHMPNPTQELALVAARVDVPIVAHYHGDIVRAGPVPAIYERFAAWFLKRVHRVAVGSPPFASSTRLLDGVRDRVTVIPYGVDVAEWEQRPALADEIRARYPGPLVVLLGRLVHYKGVLVAIEAMQHVRDATLLLVGDGPLRDEAASLIERLGVGDRTKLVGEVADDERAAYYHAADVFIFPGVSRGESYGIAQLEAMATGTPSISTELGTGTSWVNQHNQTGLVVPPRDARALADAISSVLADDERRAAMARAAQERARTELSRDRMLASLRTMYDDAVQAR
jgi:glycosyltransferase involved in cell wall biosynthesis